MPTADTHNTVTAVFFLLFTCVILQSTMAPAKQSLLPLFSFIKTPSKSHQEEARQARKEVWSPCYFQKTKNRQKSCTKESRGRWHHPWCERMAWFFGRERYKKPFQLPVWSSLSIKWRGYFCIPSKHRIISSTLPIVELHVARSCTKISARYFAPQVQDTVQT